MTVDVLNCRLTGRNPESGMALGQSNAIACDQAHHAIIHPFCNYEKAHKT